LYSYRGELVLDPFVGSGQTTKVARHLGRKFAGYDTIEKYVQLAEARLKEDLHIRAQQLVAVFDKIDKDELSGKAARRRPIRTGQASS
jgi:site-specific DNA-methyltransferase (adenine-specific)